MSDAEVVLALLEALGRRDVDAALAFVDPAIVYQNVPVPPACGLRAFERQMRLIETRFDHFEAITHHIAERDGVVLTERTDVLGLAGRKVSFWVCGTFEVRDGLVTVWRDRFDWLTVLARTGAIVPAAAASAVRARVRTSRS